MIALTPTALFLGAAYTIAAAIAVGLIYLMIWWIDHRVPVDPECFEDGWCEWERRGTRPCVNCPHRRTNGSNFPKRKAPYDQNRR